MPGRRLHVIAYDISEDGPRGRLAKFLLDYGDRIQHSVFEADLEPEDVERIMARAKPLVAAGDSLRIYALCADCAEKVRSLGRQGPIELDDIVVV
ncbi:MAG: CRISPR-associated endonuclease Cas2 [Chthonomonadales bacterium]|nr:CRISPR-associated endonuclease Cas2 [Chthonomonadales bacterium]